MSLGTATRGCGKPGPKPRSIESRILVMLNGCHEWQGQRTADGYGLIYLGDGERVYAHRWAYGRAYPEEPLTAEDKVLHDCDNPPCMNSEHLFRGTQADNMQDAARKHRMVNQNMAKTICIHGHEFTAENTRITPEGERACRACAREYARGVRARRAA